ncbi:baseplate assembly protein [Paracoccus jiaweipingae]|uniref:baseplate assembly protein n=1 Tax=unclassified Paracoccus (in: a-proteobacteria) TaxID=2688777 RepID=UPI003794EAD8
MSFTAINLTRLPAPQIIEQPDFETIFAARKARLIELAQEFGDAAYVAALAAALELESEPLVHLLQEDSYRELLLRAAVQDAGKGNLLAFAERAMLDHLAAFYGVARQVIQEADASVSPPIEEVLEDDERLRARVQLAPEGFTTAGSIGSYTFWALSASPLVKDVAVLEGMPPGEVHVAVLSTEGDGTADAALIQDVAAALNAEDVRPLCDTVVVQSAAVVPYQIEAALTFYNGPDGAVVLAAAQAAIETYVADHHRLGHDITLSGIFAALHQEGVQKVTLAAPATDLVIGQGEAGYCTGITLADGGRDV